MKELTAFINYHTIDSFDSLEPWLHMKGDSFIIFFQSLRQGFFQNSFIDFWRTTKSSVHIYQNLTHKDFLWNFEKEKNHTTSSRYLLNKCPEPGLLQ